MRRRGSPTGRGEQRVSNTSSTVTQIERRLGSALTCEGPGEEMVLAVSMMDSASAAAAAAARPRGVPAVRGGEEVGRRPQVSGHGGERAHGSVKKKEEHTKSVCV